MSESLCSRGLIYLNKTLSSLKVKSHVFVTVQYPYTSPRLLSPVENFCFFSSSTFDKTLVSNVSGFHYPQCLQPQSIKDPLIGTRSLNGPYDVRTFSRTIFKTSVKYTSLQKTLQDNVCKFVPSKKEYRRELR